MQYLKILTVLTVLVSCAESKDSAEIKQTSLEQFGDSANVFFKCKAEYINTFNRNGAQVSEKWTYKINKYFNNIVRTVSLKVERDGDEPFETAPQDLIKSKTDTWGDSTTPLKVNIYQKGDIKAFKVEHKTMGWVANGACTSVRIEPSGQRTEFIKHEGPRYELVPLRSDLTAANRALEGTWVDPVLELSPQQQEETQLPADVGKLTFRGLSGDRGRLLFAVPANPIAKVENSGRKGKQIMTGGQGVGLLGAIQLIRLGMQLADGWDGWETKDFTLNLLNDGFLGSNLPPLGSEQAKACPGRNNLLQLLFDESTAYFTLGDLDNPVVARGCLSVSAPETGVGREILTITMWRGNKVRSTVMLKE